MQSLGNRSGSGAWGGRHALPLEARGVQQTVGLTPPVQPGGDPVRWVVGTEKVPTAFPLARLELCMLSSVDICNEPE